MTKASASIAAARGVSSMNAAERVQRAGGSWTRRWTVATRARREYQLGFQAEDLQSASTLTVLLMCSHHGATKCCQGSRWVKAKAGWLSASVR